MRQYLRAGILKSREGLIFVERTVLGKNPARVDAVPRSGALRLLGQVPPA